MRQVPYHSYLLYEETGAYRGNNYPVTWLIKKNEAKIETQKFQLPVQESILMKPLSVRNSKEEKKVD